MPKPIDIKELPLEQGPAKAAWDKYNATGDAYTDTTRAVFAKGWNAALDWIPVRIQQFREIEELLRKEIEELKNQNTSS